MDGKAWIDARYLRCPLPVLKLEKAMRAAIDGGTIRIVVTDPAAPADIAALAQSRGWSMAEEDPLDGARCFALVRPR